MSKNITPIAQVLAFNAAYEKSGKTMAVFATQRNVPLRIAQLYRTRAKKHLSQVAAGSAEEGFSLICVPPAINTGIELNISGIKISVEPHFSSSALERVLCVLNGLGDRIVKR